MSILEIVFVGQCDCLFVLILRGFFPLGREAQVCEWGVNSLKNVDFSDIYPLNLMSHLRRCVSVLEIGFVGQCKVFVCLDFVHFFFSPWQ